MKIYVICRDGEPVHAVISNDSISSRTTRLYVMEKFREVRDRCNSPLDPWSIRILEGDQLSDMREGIDG